MGKNKSSRVHPPYKTKYHVGNWREHEAGLRARGDIMVWFTPEAIASWTPPNNGRRGAQRRYSDLAAVLRPRYRNLDEAALALPPAAATDRGLPRLVVSVDGPRPACSRPLHTLASRDGSRRSPARAARVRPAPSHRGQHGPGGRRPGAVGRRKARWEGHSRLAEAAHRR